METPETLIAKRGVLDPLHRLVRPEAIADAALFLMPDDSCEQDPGELGTPPRHGRQRRSRIEDSADP